MMEPEVTDIHAFREFLIEGSCSVAEAACQAHGNLDIPLLVSALHFMQEVELVHATVVDQAQEEDNDYSPEELMEFGERNAQRGTLINYIWKQIESGNETVINGIATLELDHVSEYGIADFAMTHDLARSDARLDSLEQYGFLAIPYAMPEGA